MLDLNVLYLSENIKHTHLRQVMDWEAYFVIDTVESQMVWQLWLCWWNSRIWITSCTRQTVGGGISVFRGMTRHYTAHAKRAERWLQLNADRHTYELRSADSFKVVYWSQAALQTISLTTVFTWSVSQLASHSDTWKLRCLHTKSTDVDKNVQNALSMFHTSKAANPEGCFFILFYFILQPSRVMFHSRT